jgi:hypothetical protein
MYRPILLASDSRDCQLIVRLVLYSKRFVQDVRRHMVGVRHICNSHPGPDGLINPAVGPAMHRPQPKYNGQDSGRDERKHQQPFFPPIHHHALRLAPNLTSSLSFGANLSCMMKLAAKKVTKRSPLGPWKL